MAAQKTLEALNLMTVSLEARGAHFQAIKCATAAANLAGLLPAAEARARLQLGRLLMAHTSNNVDACKCLRRAQILANQLPGVYTLKCEIASALGGCFRLMTDFSRLRKECEKGLEICAAGARSTEKTALQRWMCHFFFKLADALSIEGQRKEEVAALERGATFAAEHGMKEQQVLFILSQAQVGLLHGDNAAVSTAMDAARPLLDALAASNDTAAAAGTAAAAFLAQLRLQFNILRTLHLMRCGEYETLTKAGADSSVEAVTVLQQLLAQTNAVAPPYTWLPAGAQTVVVHLLCACILQPGGKWRAAQQHICAAKQAAQRCLAELGIGEDAGEGDLSEKAIWDGRIYLVLQVLLLEQRCQLALLQNVYDEAQSCIRHALDILGRFPNLLQQLQPTAHVMCGLYAHALDEHEAAVAHFRAAAGNAAAEQQLRVAAACLGAAAALASDAPDAVSRAVAALGDLNREVRKDLGAVEQTLAHVAAALVRLRQGATAEAKSKLQKALKVSHATHNNRQVLAGVLNCLAPLQFDAQDVAGAHQMLNASMAIAKDVCGGDLATQVATAEISDQLYERLHDEKSYASNHAYLQRKRAAWQQRAAAATADAQGHAEVLAWKPPQEA